MCLDGIEWVWIFVVNVGLLSLKLCLFDGVDIVFETADLFVDALGFDIDWFVVVLGGWLALDVVGYCIVHGGMSFWFVVCIDVDVERCLWEFVELVLLHQLKLLVVLDVVSVVLPLVMFVVCFDMVFHVILLFVVVMYVVLCEWWECYGVRWYGFYGLLYVYCSW